MTLWKVGDTADYSLFNTCRKLQYYVNNEFNLNEDMILKTSYLDLWLTRNYLFAQYGYTFESPELDAFFKMFDWYEPIYFSAYEEQPNIFKGYQNGSSLDVDGDGQLEQVYIFLYNEADSGEGVDFFVVESDGSVSSANFFMEWGTPFINFGFTNATDGNGYFLLGAHIESMDYEYSIYRYQDNTLSLQKHFDGYDIKSFDGKTLVKIDACYHFETMDVEINYQLTDSGFDPIEQDYYTYLCGLHVAKKDVSARTSNSVTSQEMTIHAGDFIQILGGDMKEWIKFENCTTNEQGWLNVTEDTVLLQPKKESVDDLFTGRNIHD